MTESLEDQINAIRNRITEIAIGVADYQSNVGRNGAPELNPVADRIEDLMLDFERLVDQIPVEARS
jgi:hypothetical protein